MKIRELAKQLILGGVIIAAPIAWSASTTAGTSTGTNSTTGATTGTNGTSGATSGAAGANTTTGTTTGTGTNNTGTSAGSSTSGAANTNTGTSGTSTGVSGSGKTGTSAGTSGSTTQPVVPATGNNNQQQNADTGSDKTTDDQLSDKVKAALIADNSLATKSITATARQGTIILTGTVSSQAERARAAQLVSSIEGVTSVKNELKVKAK